MQFRKRTLAPGRRGGQEAAGGEAGNLQARKRRRPAQPGGWKKTEDRRYRQRGDGIGAKILGLMWKERGR